MSSPISRRTFLQSTAFSSGLFVSSHSAADDPRPSVEWPQHFFLSENFAPVHEEITTGKLPVIGQIPAELDGMFLRNGPNPQVPPRGNYHWFDGDGMIHAIRFQEGEARFLNRYVKTAGWKAEHDAGKSLWSGLADPIDVKEVTLKLLRGENPFKNTANTALIWHHGKLLALWELGFPHELTLPELETAGTYSFGGNLRHAMTAHPKIDRETGEMMVIGYSPLPPFVQYSVFDATGRLTHTTPIPVRRPVFMHDFAITEKYTLLLELPAVFDPYAPQQNGEFVRYTPELGARIGLLDRHSSGENIRWFEIEACFVYHVLNAFEADNKIHLYACRMPRYPKAFGLTSTTNADDFNDIFGDSRPVMYRWSIDLQTGTVKEDQLDDRLAEYPRVNDRHTGKPTKFGYAIQGSPDTSDLLQYELQSGASKKHSFGPGRIAGETIFAARPGSTEENDGWLITYVYDRATQSSECVVLDARDVTQPPIARISLPQRVPYGFHALWVDGAVL